MRARNATVHGGGGGGVRTRYYATEEEIVDGGVVGGQTGDNRTRTANTGLLRHGRRALPPSRSAGHRESWFRGVGRET